MRSVSRRDHIAWRHCESNCEKRVLKKEKKQLVEKRNKKYINEIRQEHEKIIDLYKCKRMEENKEKFALYTARDI